MHRGRVTLVGKRLNQEGHIRQRADGRWEGRLSFLDEHTGQRKRLSFYAPTEAAVAAKVREARKRLEAGDPAKDATMTVAAWCERWCDVTLEASSRKPTTKQLMRGLIRSHVLDTKLGRKPLAKLRASDFDEWVLELRRKTRTVAGVEQRALSDASIQRVFRVVSVVLDGAVRDSHLAVNPARKVERITAERKEARVLSAAEVSAILSAAKAMDEDPRGHRTHNFALFATIAATGMRKGEALALRWADVDFDEGTIAVRGTLSRVGSDLVVTTPKTSRSRRVLAPADGVMRLLKSHKAAQAEDRLRAGNQWHDTGHVFTTALGEPRDPRAVLRSIVAAARRAGVDDVDVHTLRHSAATAMLEQGTHLKAVSELLGHAGTQITADTYAHLTAPTARKALDGLGASIGL